jgi:hypothetical protein
MAKGCAVSFLSQAKRLFCPAADNECWAKSSTDTYLAVGKMRHMLPTEVEWAPMFSAFWLSVALMGEFELPDDSTAWNSSRRKANQFEVVARITIVTEGYDRISMHGVRRTLLQQQAALLGTPLEQLLISQKPPINGKLPRSPVGRILE